MHEMAITREVVDIVVKEAEAVGALQVSAVHLTIGYMRDIVEEYIDGLFAHLARGTVAEHAELVIVRVPFTVRCNRCGQVYHFNPYSNHTHPAGSNNSSDSTACPVCHEKDCEHSSLTHPTDSKECPACHEKDYRLNTGREFYINAIEVVGATASVAQN